MALDVLPAQASSVACERLFSAAKHITSDTRSRLSTEMFEKLQLLKAAWRKEMVDISRENEAIQEEVAADEAMFAGLETLDAEDLAWDVEEDSIM